MTVLWALTKRNQTSGSFDDMQHHPGNFKKVAIVAHPALDSDM
jgi:hypothetical protein